MAKKRKYTNDQIDNIINSSVMPKTSAHKQKTKQKILRAAGRLFWKNRYLGTSVSDIAKLAGVNKATVYAYFKSKPLILFEVSNESLIELHDHVKVIANLDTTSEEKLALMVECVVKWATSFKNWVSVADTERVHLPPKLYSDFIKTRDEYEKLFVEVVTDILQKQKTLNKNSNNPKILTFFILGTMNSILRWYNPAGELSPSEIAYLASDFVCQALNIKLFPQKD
ncbi:TetR/AcrR family transcriptional regulator [Chloroflexota bacterium]